MEINNNLTTSEEQYNKWFFSHLLGGNTSPYCAYTAAASRYQKQALINFCRACCPQKFNKGECKQICEKARRFEYLTYTK